MLRARDLRRLDPHGREKGPVALILGSFGDPLLQDGLFGAGERFAAFLRRHDVIVRVRQHRAGDHLALFRAAGHQRDVAGLRRLHRLLANVEPQLAFAMAGIRAVAMKALLIENRPHIAVKLELLRGGSREGEEQNQGA